MCGGNNVKCKVEVIELENGYQVAGFITDSTEAATGTMPMVMLQISI